MCLYGEFCQGYNFVSGSELVHSWKIKRWDFVISFLRVVTPFRSARFVCMCVYHFFSFVILILVKLSLCISLQWYACCPFFSLAVLLPAMIHIFITCSLHSLCFIHRVVLKIIPRFLRRIIIHNNFSWSAAKMWQRSPFPRIEWRERTEKGKKFNTEMTMTTEKNARMKKLQCGKCQSKIDGWFSKIIIFPVYVLVQWTFAARRGHAIPSTRHTE